MKKLLSLLFAVMLTITPALSFAEENVKIVPESAEEQIIASDDAIAEGNANTLIKEITEVEETQPDREDNETVQEKAETIQKNAEPLQDEVEIVQKDAEPVQQEADLVQDETETVQGEAKTVKEENEPVQEVNEPTQDVAELVQEKAEPIQQEAESVQEEAEPVQDKVGPLQDETEPLQQDAEPVKEEAEPVQSDAETVKEENESVQEVNEPVQDKVGPLQDEAEPFQKDAEPVQEEAEPVQSNAETVKEENESVQDVNEPVQDEVEPAQEDDKPVQEINEPIQEAEILEAMHLEAEKKSMVFASAPLSAAGLQTNDAAQISETSADMQKTDDSQLMQTSQAETEANQQAEENHQEESKENLLVSTFEQNSVILSANAVAQSEVKSANWEATNETTAEAESVPVITEATAAKQVLGKNKQQTFSITTTEGANYLMLFDSAQSDVPLAVFSAEEYSQMDENGQLIWNIPYAFAENGIQHVTFGVGKEADKIEGDRSEEMVFAVDDTEVISASAALDLLPVNTNQKFTVTTSEDAKYLMVYDKEGNLVSQYKATAKNSQVVDGQRVWNVRVSISSPDLKKLSFKTGISETPTASKATVSYKTDATEVLSATKKSNVIDKNADQTFTVTTSKTAQYLVMYNSKGKAIGTFDAKGYSKVSGDTRVWSVTKKFGTLGAESVSFRAGKTKNTTGLSQDVNFAVDNTVVKTVEAKNAIIPVGIRQTFTVKTTADAQYLMLYDKEGKLVERFTASDKNSTVKNGLRTWNIKEAFTTAGSSSFSFRAGITKTPTKSKQSVTFTLDGTKVLSASAKSNVIAKNKMQTLTVETSKNANYLKMYDEQGKLIATYDAKKNSVMDGKKRVWTVSPQFNDAGNQTVSFRAGQTKSTTTYSKSASFLVDDSKIYSADVKNGALYLNGKQDFTVTTDTDAKYLTMYDKDGTALGIYMAADNSELVDGKRVWHITQQFTEAGDVNLTFKASRTKKAVTKAAETSFVVAPIKATSASAFEVYEDTLYSYTGASAKVGIPENLGIKTISYSAFANNDEIKILVIPEGVTTLPEWAFYNCDNLEQVILPSTLKSIPEYLFYNCPKLKKVVIQNGTKSIGESAFSWCPSLQSITIPESVKTIEQQAFYNDEKLKTVVIQNGTKSIGESAFAWCPSLQSITIPGSVKTIEHQAFYYDKNLKTVVMKEGVERVKDGAFDLCAKLSSVDLPATVKYIVPGAFTPITVLTVDQNSLAMKYAISNGHMFTLRGKQPNTFTAKSVDAKASEIVKKITDKKMSTYEKALVLHNWLIANANYDHTYTNYYEDGVLLKGKGVCNSYSLAYGLLLSKAGITNAYEYGNDHIWNLVKFGNSWAHVDVTWDDPGEGGLEQIYYFGVTDYALQGVSNHERTKRVYTSNNYKTSYAYKSGQLKSIINDWTNKITEQIKSKKTKIVETFNQNDVGLNERMAVEMVQDTGITVNTTKYKLNVSYQDLKNGQYRLTIKPMYSSK
ncbi:MAG: leucine-rich repeat protein [Clostridia bacterium]|nr:leucine-rich repeat protein [Clostridia bacterium]